MTKVCIYGAGAVGGWIAARLAKAGTEVSVVARGAHLAAIRANGLRLQSGDTTFTVKVNATDDPRTLGAQDYVVIGVKAPALPAVAAGIAPLLGPHTAIVPAMNGIPWWYFEQEGGPLSNQHLNAIDPGGALARTMPIERIIGCVVYPSVSVPEPGFVQHKSGERVVIGEPSGTASERATHLSALLTQAGFECSVTPNIRREILLKLWGNVNFNPVSLLTWQATDRLLADPYTEELFIATMVEAKAVFARLGVAIEMTPQARLDVTRKLGHVKTSMLQDGEAGRPIELDALVGVVVEIAERLSIPIPHIRAIYGLARLRGRSLGIYPEETPS
jgi:2-dehydropantoate 2-reductase